MRVIGLCLFVVLCVGAWRWMAQVSAKPVRVSDEDRALAAQQVGVGLAVTREGFQPASLEAVRELYETPELEAAREALAGALADTGFGWIRGHPTEAGPGHG